MFKLVIADDEGKTTVVPLVRDEITIGRKEGNTIRLTERNVSRRHAKLRKGGGGYLVEDLQSYNGVKVNGRRVGGEIVLKAGDQITIGDYQLALQLDDGATIPETTVPSAAPNGGAEAATAMMAAPAAPTMPAGGVGHPAPMAQPPARIVMTSQPAPGAEFALARPITRIGRAEELDVWINHRSISREHAEITNDGGTIRIKDLGSANGVRVNGRDTQQGELRPGDTVELGQVRFRFVAPGEQFVFDAERTMQLDAMPAPSGPNRAPIFVAAGIVGIAVIGAVAVAMSGGGGQTVTPIDDGAAVAGGPVAPVVSGTPTTPEVTAPVGPSADELIAGFVAQCLAARNSGNFDVAIQRAGEALALRADDARALECQQGAQQDLAESDAFARGVAARDRGDLSGAYLAFDELPPRSQYRGRPEVAQTMRDFANDTLAQAQAALASDPEEAMRLAQTVMNMAQVDAGTRRAADVLARRARPRIASAGGGGGGGGRPDRARPQHRGGGGGGGGAATAPGTGGGGGGGGGGSATPVRPETGGGGAASGGSTLSPMAAARECLGRADNDCVIRALAGRARSEAEWRLLIETYRAMGRSGDMLESMERYIQRFPSGPRTPQYRQILLQHGR